MVAFFVPSREVVSINFSKVSEASFLEVVRALGIVALVLLTVVLTGLETIFVSLTASFIAVVKHVMVVPEIVWRVTIWVAIRIAPASKSKRTIDAIVGADNHYSATPLCLSFA